VYQIPITFREVYSNTEHEFGGEPCYTGFTPFTTDNISVEYRAVEIVPMLWRQGGMLRFAILDYERNSKTGIRYWREIHDFYIHDVESEESFFHPTSDQASIICLLASGDLRGKSAVDAVSGLYYSLVLTNENCGFTKFLPELVEWTHRSAVDQSAHNRSVPGSNPGGSIMKMTTEGVTIRRARFARYVPCDK